VVKLKDRVLNNGVESETRNSGHDLGSTAKQVTLVWICVTKGG